jgi:hypothetical protein
MTLQSIKRISGRVAQVVCLPTKHEALSSNPSTPPTPQKNSEIASSIWKLNNTLQNNPSVIEEMAGKIL